MLKNYIESVKRLSTDKDGVVSLEYVVVGAVIVAVVIGVFQGTGTNSLTGALSTGFGAIVTAMGGL
jgi:pilus assembly protein Flp/PilA